MSYSNKIDPQALKLCFVGHAVIANKPTSLANKRAAREVAAYIEYLDLDKNPLDVSFDQPIIGCWVHSNEDLVSVDLGENELPKTLALVSHTVGEQCSYPSDSKTRRQSWRDLSRTINDPSFLISVTLKSGSFQEEKNMLFKAMREDTGLEGLPTKLRIELLSD